MILLIGLLRLCSFDELYDLLIGPAASVLLHTSRVGRIMLKKLPIILFPYSHKNALLFLSDYLLFSHYSH